MNLESKIIQLFSDNSHKIGDDAAFDGRLMYSQDAFFENVHFKRAWLTMYEIGYKAMQVNISDAIAMNAKPLYALITLAVPKTLSKQEVESLVLGLKEGAALYGCEIIGGDTLQNSKVDLSITIISQTKKPLYRHTAKEGDLLAFTGVLGQSQKDLRRLLRGAKVNKNSRFKRLTLRDTFIQKAYPLLHSGMDISDGLFEDSRKLTKSIGRSFSVLTRLDKSMGCSGEEYEMLISFPAKNRKALQRIAKHTRTPLTIFGKITKIKTRNSCKANHF